MKILDTEDDETIHGSPEFYQMFADHTEKCYKVMKIIRAKQENAGATPVAEEQVTGFATAMAPTKKPVNSEVADIFG
jgi:hypothetical protein